MTTAIPRIQKYVTILWPSFLVAGLATIVYFTVFDPVQILECSGYESPSRLGAYTIGFFVFWGMTALSCILSVYFGKPCSRMNGQANQE